MVLGGALPVAAGEVAAPAPRPVMQDPSVSQPVFALPGRLRPAQNQPFGTYLIANNGTIYGLAGETPAIETQIVQYREQGDDVQVKVWGTLYPEGRTTTTPEIVASSILPVSGIPMTPTPTATPQSSGTPTIRVQVQALNVRSGPDVGYPRIGGLQFNDVCEIIGAGCRLIW
jgi:hypothetical protein